MRRIFADAQYWVALLNDKDQSHRAALAVSRTLQGTVGIVTTDACLSELLAYFSARGSHLRQVASTFVENILSDPGIVIHPGSRSSFLAALALYKARPDKGYSHVDCMSMLAMRQEGITEILTQDAHFGQEGFTILL